MTDPDAIELDVRLRVVGDELSGEVSRDGRPSFPFSGWLGLLGAVERACALRLPVPDETNDRPMGEKR
jgi:hypothetical protein